MRLRFSIAVSTSEYKFDSTVPASISTTKAKRADCFSGSSIVFVFHHPATGWTARMLRRARSEAGQVSSSIWIEPTSRRLRPNIQPSCTIVVTVSSGMPVSFFFYICDGGLSADSVRCLQHAPEIVADVVLLKLRCELLHGREGFVRPLPARRVDFGP
jgi:hypothetical protein